MTTIVLNIVASLRPKSWSHFFAGIKHHLLEWGHRTRSRLELSTMGDHELWDLGMTRGTAIFEATKPFWQE